MCGIFAYLNYNVPRERRCILEVLFDADLPSSSSSAPYAGPSPLVFRQEGKIENLVRSVYAGQHRFSPSFLPLDPFQSNPVAAETLRVMVQSEDCFFPLRDEVFLFDEVCVGCLTSLNLRF
jgi:hypothetical protein